MNEELKIIISAEVEKLKQGVESAKSQLNSFKQQVNKASADVESKFKSIGTSIKNGITAGVKAAAAGIAALGAALVGSAALTEEYRVNQAKLNAAFEQAGLSGEAASGVYKELYATIGESDQAVESAANIALLTESEKDAAKWAELASGVLGTFHDTLQPEAFYEAANETAKLGEATGAFAQMLEQTGIMSVDEFNKKLSECSTEAEKQALMLKVSQDAMGEAGAAYDKSTEKIQKQREAQSKLTETLAKVGDAVTPVITAFTNFANDALAKVVPHIQQLAETYGPMLEEALGQVAETVSTIFGFISDNWEILASIAGVIAGIAAAIGLYNAVAAVKAAMAAAEVASVWGLVSAYAAQAVAMAAALAPYLLIVAAIGAVIAIIVVCIKHWDEIKEKVKEVWDSISNWVSEGVEKVKEKFNEMKENISEKVENIKANVKQKFNQVKETMGTVMEAAKTTVKEKLDNIKSAYEENGGGVKGVVAAVMEGVKGYYSAGYDFINKLTHGKLDEIKNAMKSKMEAAKNAVSGVLENIKSKFSSIMDNAKNIVNNAINKIKSFFNFKWSLPKIKLPHFSISGKFSLNPPSVPRFSISWYQRGGVFDNPTLFGYGGRIGGLGENGAEAIVPLENNLGWLDKLASMLDERMEGNGGNRQIILQVDGKTFAEIAVDSINDLTKQTGSLPLRFA